MNYFEKSVEEHRTKQGKLSVESLFPIESMEDLAIAYTPGVAEPCRRIAANKEEVYNLTIKGRSVAIVTDGTAVLGLGDIGPEAALPVMEGKAALFKRFGNLDGYPICLATKDVDEIVETVKRISPGFGGINLEDISAPRCFEIERRLIEALDIPVMHDDQHGTAVVVLAGLTNALKVVGKNINEIHVVLSGSGAGGLGIASLLLEAGVTKMSIIDSVGIIAIGRDGMNEYKDIFAKRINPEGKTGSLADALVGADVFIGVSKPGVVTQDMIRSMNKDSIIFALANPVPEIMPEEAKAAGCAIIGTGRSDYPNQVNNVLAFPGIFKGAMAARKKITPSMRVVAAQALAAMVEHPTTEKIIPSPFDPGVAETVAAAVMQS